MYASMSVSWGKFVIRPASPTVSPCPALITKLTCTVAIKKCISAIAIYYYVCHVTLVTLITYTIYRYCFKLYLLFRLLVTYPAFRFD